MQQRIAQNVASLIRDGDTIQLGIGSLPNACARNLMDKKDLGIHSEMFTNLMGTMVEKGVITGARKNLNPGKHIFCFAGGTNHRRRTSPPGGEPKSASNHRRCGISPPGPR